MDEIRLGGSSRVIHKWNDLAGDGWLISYFCCRARNSADRDQGKSVIQAEKRISVFLPALHGGGAEKTMLALAGGIADRGYPVDLVLAQAVGPYLSDIPGNVRLVDLKSKGTLASLPALMRYLRRERPDGMISALSRANIVALLARKLTGSRLPLVVNEQNTLSAWARDGSKWQMRITPAIARRCYRWATAVGAVSQGVADDLVHVCKIPAKRVEVLYNPGATPEVLRKAQLPLDHPWFAEGQPPALVAVGRLATQKDFGNLLRAFGKLRRSRPLRLIILGEGPERPKLESLIAELGLGDDVSLPGFVDNPYTYMAHSAAFVLSSLHEGLPTVLVEALACGCRIVATDCPSGADEILRHGELGMLVPVADSDRLAEAIEQTLLGQGPVPSRESWQPYSLSCVVEKYLSVLLPADGQANDNEIRQGFP